MNKLFANEIVVFMLISAVIILLPKFNKDYLSKNSTIAMKSILSILIILHHISQNENIISLLAIFNSVGRLSVSMFLFISAYGLMIRLES